MLMSIAADGNLDEAIGLSCAGQQAANGPTSSAAKSAQSAVKKLGTTALKFWRVRDVSAK